MSFRETERSGGLGARLAQQGKAARCCRISCKKVHLRTKRRAYFEGRRQAPTTRPTFRLLRIDANRTAGISLHYS